MLEKSNEMALEISQMVSEAKNNLAKEINKSVTFVYWNSGSGNCYNGPSYDNTDCDFTNTGLSNEAKEYAIDQTIYLGGYKTGDDIKPLANELYKLERNGNIIQNPTDGITRTTSWTGKVGLLYSSDYSYALDLNNPTGGSGLGNFGALIENNYNYTWLSYRGHTITPDLNYKETLYLFKNEGFNFWSASNSNSVHPTLTLDPSLVFDDTTDGSREQPYKVSY